LKKLAGNRDIEDSLERLDKLTQEEARMASAEQLKMAQNIDGKVMGVDERVKGVQGKMQYVSNKVQDVDDRVQDIDSNIRGVDDKLDQANRSLFP
jgi:archaellum component FlaC